MPKTKADTSVPGAPTSVRIRPTGERRNALTEKVNAEYVIALSETEIATETIPGSPAAHSLLNDLTQRQARRLRGLGVPGETYHFLPEETTEG